VANAPTNGSSITTSTNIIVSGTANGQDIFNESTLGGTGFVRDTETVISADVCNSAGQCVNKSATVTLNGRNDMANWALTWNTDELPAGTYQGTIVVHNSRGGVVDTGMVHFVIPVKEIPVKVVKGQPFNVRLGSNSTPLDLPLSCSTPNNGGFSITRNANGMYFANNSGTGLTATTEVTCGGTKIVINVVEPANPTVSNVNLY
jgi:hypothetical protein